MRAEALAAVLPGANIRAMKLDFSKGRIVWYVDAFRHILACLTFRGLWMRRTDNELSLFHDGWMRHAPCDSGVRGSWNNLTVAVLRFRYGAVR